MKDAAGNGYEYLGSLIYRRTPSGLELESTDFAGGRILKTSAKYDLRYFVRDYLGSVRAIVNAQGQRLEAIDYMPYGSRWRDPMRLVTDNRFLFNGKEWQPTGNLDVLDYGARHYDPLLGRWFNPDPAMQFLNPYTFCGNDPVNSIDTDGRARHVTYDNKNMIITIRAVYYHDLTTGDFVRSGIKIWNNFKNYTYTDDKGRVYKVVFELSACRVKKPAYEAHNDPAGNYVEIRKTLGVDKNGDEIAGGAYRNIIILVWNYRHNKFATAHEIGHTLGTSIDLPDGSDNHSSSGLMVKHLNDPRFSESIIQKDIDEIINSGEGPVDNKEEKEKSTSFETSHN